MGRSPTSSSLKELLEVELLGQCVRRGGRCGLETLRGDKVTPCSERGCVDRISEKHCSHKTQLLKYTHFAKTDGENSQDKLTRQGHDSEAGDKKTKRKNCFQRIWDIH